MSYLIPFLRLFRKNNSGKWYEKCQKAFEKIRFYRKREVCGQPGKSVVKDVRAFPNSYHIEPKMGTRFRWTKNRLKTTIYA